MGKALIVDGADFSQCAVKEVKFNELVLEQGGITIVAGDTFGENGNTIATIRVRSVTNILIRNGESIILSGLKGLNGNYGALKFDFAYYSAIERTHSNAVGSASNYNPDKYFPCNIYGDDSVIVTNDFGEDYYFGFTFAAMNKTNEISYTNYSPLKYSSVLN